MSDPADQTTEGLQEAVIELAPDPASPRQKHEAGRAARREAPTWLTPGVWGIGTASFLADVGHEIPTALLPSLLTITLGAPAAALGFVEGLADGVAGISRLAGGALADDPQRRRTTAVGGYTSTAILSALIGVADTVWQVGLLRVGAWASRGLRVPARNALLADLVPREVYGRAYGFERAMDNLGAIVGPIAALVLVSILGVRTTILLSVIPGLLAALAILFAIRRIPPAAGGRTRERQPLRIQVQPVMQGKLGRILIGTGVFEVGHVAATLLILRTSQLLTPDMGQDRATQVSLALYVGYNVAATLASVPAGRVGDRKGTPLVLAVGVGLFFVAYVSFALNLPSVLWLGFAFVVAGVAIGCVETSQHAAVANFAPAAIRGSAFGLLAAMQSFGNIVASTVAGVLWTAFSPQIAFFYLAGWTLLATGMLTRLALQARGQRP